MLNTKFRKIIEKNKNTTPVSDFQMITAICVVGINMLVACITSIIFVYKTLFCIRDILKYLLILLWNSLTKGNEIFDLSIIITCFVLYCLFCFILKRIADLINNKFLHLNDIVKQKNKEIEYLMSVVFAKDEKILNLECKDSLNEKNK